MTTVLLIILVVLIVFNVWLAIYTLKREKKRRRQLQERIDEYDHQVGEIMNELGLAKQRNDENVKLLAQLKDVLAKKDRLISKLQEGVSDEVEKPKVNLLALDFQDLQKSYNELAQRYENPSKRYLINHLIKAYDVKNLTSLAKALGVSKSAISRMRK